MIATASRSRRRWSWAAGIATRASPSTCSATRRGSSITAAWSPAIGSTSSISGARIREAWAGGWGRAADHRAGAGAGARLRDPAPAPRPRLGAAHRPRRPVDRGQAARRRDHLRRQHRRRRLVRDGGARAAGGKSTIQPHPLPRLRHRPPALGIPGGGGGRGPARFLEPRLVGGAPRGAAAALRPPPPPHPALHPVAGLGGLERRSDAALVPGGGAGGRAGGLPPRTARP